MKKLPFFFTQNTPKSIYKTFFDYKVTSLQEWCGNSVGFLRKYELFSLRLEKGRRFFFANLLFVLKQKVTKSSRLDHFAKKWLFLLRKSPNLRGLEIALRWWILAALQTLGIFRCVWLKCSGGRNNHFSWRKMLLSRGVDLIFKNERRGGLVCLNQPGDDDWGYRNHGCKKLFFS